MGQEYSEWHAGPLPFSRWAKVLCRLARVLTLVVALAALSEVERQSFMWQSVLAILVLVMCMTIVGDIVKHQAGSCKSNDVVTQRNQDFCS